MSDRKYALKVTVESRYLPEQSSPEDRRFSFAYTIRITNAGSVPSQVISRHWLITDALDRTQEVKGAGVVGQQPVLAPGDAILQHVPDLAAVAVAVDLHVTAHPRVQVGNPVPVLAEDARAHRVPNG